MGGSSEARDHNSGENVGMPVGQTEVGLPGRLPRMDRCGTPGVDRYSPDISVLTPDLLEGLPKTEIRL